MTLASSITPPRLPRLSDSPLEDRLRLPPAPDPERPQGERLTPEESRLFLQLRANATLSRDVRNSLTEERARPILDNLQKLTEALAADDRPGIASQYRLLAKQFKDLEAGHFRRGVTEEKQGSFRTDYPRLFERLADQYAPKSNPRVPLGDPFEMIPPRRSSPGGD